jgi:putative DNA-invertase from lambdoid prophage Rac
MTTCAIWCRVSKTEQEMANQLDELRQWAQRKGFEITREYAFEVSASNGSTRHREMLGQALSDARLGRFELMLVWALDRVSREGVEATLAILRRFAGHGTAVWSLKEPWTETADPRMAELLASLYAWMAARSPAAAPNGPGPDSSAVNAKACRSAGSPARPIRSRASAAATLPAGNGNELRRGDASPCRFASCGLKIRRPV